MPASSPPSSWYRRWQKPPVRDDRGWRRPVGRPGADSGSTAALSTRDSYYYLLDSLRTNAPGYAEQDAYALSRQYVGTAYLAINKKSVQASCAEMTLYEEGDDPEEKTPLSGEEEASELFRFPNSEDTFGEILEQVSIQHDCTGTALLWLPHDDRSDYDRPNEMYVFSTASVLPQPISPRYPGGAYLVQPWYPAGPYAQIPVSQSVGAIVPAEQVLRIKAPHLFFRWIGYAALYAISAQMDAARMIDLSRTNHMARGIDPTALLSWDPSVVRPDENTLRRLEAQFRNIWAGPQNAGQIITVPAGAKLERLSNTPAEMAYESGWMQLLDFGLAALGVNKAVAGMTDGITYATLYASLQAFYLMTLNPFLAKIAQKMTAGILKRFFNKRFACGLKGQSIKDDSIDGQVEQRLIGAGAIRIGELRKRNGLPPSEKDKEWAGAAPPGQGQPGAPGGAPPGGEAGGKLPGLLGELAGGGEEEDNDAEKSRPDNDEGEGSLGPRMNRKSRFAGMLPEAHARRVAMIEARLEKAMSNGHARPAHWRR